MNQIVEEVLPVHVYVQGSNYGASSPLMQSVMLLLLTVHCHCIICVVWSGWFWTRQTNCLKTDQVILVSGIRYVLYCISTYQNMLLYSTMMKRVILHCTYCHGPVIQDGLYILPPYLYLIKVRKVWSTLFVIVCTAILVSSTGIENDFFVCLSTHLLD